MFGEEGDAVRGTGDFGAADNQWLGVYLVFDLADPSGVIGVRKPFGLQVVQIEEAVESDREGKIAGGIGSFFDRCCAGRRSY